MAGKHTAGPWSVRFDTRHEFWLVTADSGEIEICQDRAWGPEFEDEDRANARLIAAAPDLLEALELAVRQNDHDMLLTGDELRLCRAAIARATQPLPPPNEE